MLKKRSNILLSLVAVIFLVIGIMYSVCPVIPGVRYYASDYEFVKFSRNNTVKIYSNSSYSGPKLQDVGLYAFDYANSTLIINDGYNVGVKISDNKRTLIDRNDEIAYSAKFNPTFIFYLISAGAIVILVWKNIIKQNNEEIGK